jgi:glycolate oxidase FAD binding subunit
MLTPASEAELSEAVAAAGGPLRILGGGTRPVGRPVAGEALSVAGLTGVELYEPGALTIVARAGTPLAEIEALLAKENQRLPFEPMDHRALWGPMGFRRSAAWWLPMCRALGGYRRARVGTV